MGKIHNFRVSSILFAFAVFNYMGSASKILFEWCILNECQIVNQYRSILTK